MSDYEEDWSELVAENTALRARLAEVEGALREANINVIAFCSMWGETYQRDHELDGLYPTHFDILKKAGAHLDSFKRATNAKLATPSSDLTYENTEFLEFEDLVRCCSQIDAALASAGVSERLVPTPGDWRLCPSTHCERRQECSSPHECSGTGKRAKAAIPSPTSPPPTGLAQADE